MELYFRQGFTDNGTDKLLFASDDLESIINFINDYIEKLHFKSYYKRFLDQTQSQGCILIDFGDYVNFFILKGNVDFEEFFSKCQDIDKKNRI